MEYLSVGEARGRGGLRLVLTVGVPGPWGEAAKGFFQVKGVPFLPVEQIGGGENRELLEWTGQTSAPVAAWEDEPPMAALSDILFLAERLGPKPALIPDDAGQRAEMFGLLREITGREGFGWSRRLGMFAGNVEDRAAGPQRDAGLAFARRYGYTPEAGAAAPARVAGILELLAARLREQAARGRRYLVGDGPSAVDIAWAAFSNMIEPLPHELCPMPDGIRALYAGKDEREAAALAPELLEHRDLVFREHLTLPLDF